MRALICTSIAVIAMAFVSAASADNHTWQWRYQVWMPKHWINLAACESGSNPPNWRHNSGTYQGAFGFHHGSWDQFNVYGYPRDAHLATPWQQWRVALRIAARYGIASPWGCWRGAHHAWVRNGLPERGVYR